MAQPLALTKFCDIETGLKILNSQSLRWSAPSCFRDPFEPDHETALAFGAEDLLKAMIKRATGLLFGPSLPYSEQNKLVAAIRRWRDEDRFASEEEAGTVLRQLLSPLAHQHFEKVQLFHQQWQQYAARSRICCFSDKPENLLAWQRFGDNHAGIALKFSCGDDTALGNPRAMQYRDHPPVITRLSDQVEILFGQKPAPDQAQFIDQLLNKSRLNRGEQEWRVLMKKTAMMTFIT